MTSINPAERLAFCEAQIDFNNSKLGFLENQMDSAMSQKSGDALADEPINVFIASLRGQMQSARQALGFWKGEVQHWRQELNDLKKQVNDSNSLGSTGG